MTGLDAPASGIRMSLGVSRPLPALLVLVALLALVLGGLWAGAESHGPPTSPGPGDAALYRRVVDDIRGGATYYQAAAQEQRRNGYPMRPFVVVRPPLLAVTMAVLPNELARSLALDALGLATVVAWGWRLARMGVGKLELAAGGILLATGVSVTFASSAYLFHETWAGLLIALSLALRRPERWAASLCIGLLAALTRELAAAYLLAMAALAWRDGCRREALAWLAALAAVAVALVAHAAAVEAQMFPGDRASQSWLNIGGWRFVLAAIRWNTVLLNAPRWAAAVVAPFALLGLAAWRGPLGERLALTVFGYVAAFVFVGRPENHYWGLLIAPLWPLGLVLAPTALATLCRSLSPHGPGLATLTSP